MKEEVRIVRKFTTKEILKAIGVNSRYVQSIDYNKADDEWVVVSRK